MLPAFLSRSLGQEDELDAKTQNSRDGFGFRGVILAQKRFA
jgi:hypothetical protein